MQAVTFIFLPIHCIKKQPNGFSLVCTLPLFVVMKGVFDWYMTFTSTGGLTQFYGSKNNLSKVFWMVLTLSGLILTIWSIERTISNFLQNGIQ